MLAFHGRFMWNFADSTTVSIVLEKISVFTVSNLKVGKEGFVAQNARRI